MPYFRMMGGAGHGRARARALPAVLRPACFERRSEHKLTMAERAEAATGAALRRAEAAEEEG